MSGTSSTFAVDGCSIEVYPFEGENAPYVIQGGQIRSVMVSKNIRGGTPGTVQIELAPGGPFGPESSPTWAEVITPMSHILVGMQRGGNAAIVLDGMVNQVSESQIWQSTPRGSTATRVPVITASDFTWFFRTFNWYALTLFGMTTGAPLGAAMGFDPAGTAQAIMSQGLLGPAPPAEIARNWYEKIMAGPGAILGKTFVPYAGGSHIPFHTAVSTVWENYSDTFVPYGDFFMAAESSWMDKFLSILPMPWYEFFVTTAPSGAYGIPAGSSGVSGAGTLFSMASMPAAPPAGPMLVGRVNPIPTLGMTADAASNNSAFTGLNMAAWNALPLTTLSTYGFVSSEIEFDAAQATNFYMLNPTNLQLYFGNNNNNNIPFPFLFIGAADPASIHRYGFKPSIGTFRWLYDPQGLVAQGKFPDALNYAQIVATLLGKYVSWNHPTPLMAKAGVVLPLSPDILIGTKFRYAPFKDGQLWDFYVETVQHRFVFGGQSSTTLGLSRGLPTAVYADASTNGVLRNIHLGNAQRVNGDYAVGLPAGTAPALGTFGPPETIRTMIGNFAQIFVTPQPKTQ